MHQVSDGKDSSDVDGASGSQPSKSHDLLRCPHWSQSRIYKSKRGCK